MGQEYGSAALLQPKAAPAVLQVRLPAANTVTVVVFVNVIGVLLFAFNFAEKVTVVAAEIAVGAPLIAPVVEFKVKPAGRFVTESSLKLQFLFSSKFHD